VSPTTRARRYPEPLDGLTAGPLTGVTDSQAPAAARHDRARRLLNCYVQSGPGGLAVVGRPGFAQFGVQLGAAGRRTGQLVTQYTQADGSEFSLAVVGGIVYTLDWNTETATEVLNDADFASASITRSTTARWYAVQLADQIVFSDGVNTPFMWDGTSHGGLTALTNADAWTGQPWVYYAKAFAVVLADRSGFEWSEENDPTTGYQTGGFNNAWNPLGASGFTHGAGTNDAMYVFQARRVIRIEGQVDDNFQTTGTRSDVSETDGTLAPPLVTDLGVVFVNAAGKPFLIPTGGRAIPFWKDCGETVGTAERTALGTAILLYYSPANLLLIGLPEQGESVVTMFLVFRFPQPGDDFTLPDFTGVWDVGPVDAAGMLVNADGKPVLVHLGAGDGYVYLHGLPDGNTWNDGYASGTVAIPHTVIPMALGPSRTEDKHADRATLVLQSPTAMMCNLRAKTPYGTTDALAFSATGAGDRLGSTFVLGTSELAAFPPEYKQDVAPEWFGRWFEPELTHETLNERFGFVSMELAATVMDDSPGAP
jgi:hypothetical protein